MDCGYKENPHALQFDHRPDEIKLCTVSSLVGRSWVRIKEEIAKCDVVCANCHCIRTWNRSQAAKHIGQEAEVVEVPVCNTGD